MARRRKSPLARPRNQQSAPDAANKITGPVAPPGERMCWLCSEPLKGGVVSSLLGEGVFEVHRSCYDRALKS